MTFLSTPRFPDDIGYGSQGGPSYETSIVVVRSGHESRNVNWTYPRHQYDVAYGVRTIDDLEELIEFFHAVGGKAYGFRFKDWSDYKSCNTGVGTNETDQLIGTGDAAETAFQLVKVYTKGSFSRTRIISKPVTGTVSIALNDVNQGSGWTVDTTTGIVTFSSPPGESVTVKAGYQFDVPVRFDTDTLQVNIESYNTGTAQVPIIEIRDIT